MFDLFYIDVLFIVIVESPLGRDGHLYINLINKISVLFNCHFQWFGTSLFSSDYTVLSGDNCFCHLCNLPIKAKV